MNFDIHSGVKKLSHIFYLLILTVALTVKQPVFAEKESTSVKSVCKDALIANLPDQGKDILSGAIMIARQLHPSDPQVTLYHIFLATMTEVRVNGGPMTYTNPSLLNFLRRHNLLEDFQNFLLNNLGLNRDHLDTLFEKKSDGTLILNTDTQLDHNYKTNFNNYTPDTDTLLTEVTQYEINDFFNDFFLGALLFNNPIRRFFFDRLTVPLTFLEKTLGRLFDKWSGHQTRFLSISTMYLGIERNFFKTFGVPSHQTKIKEEVESIYHENGSSEKLFNSTEITPPADSIIFFDFTNRRASSDFHHLHPSPYFFAHSILHFSNSFRKDDIIKVLEQQTVDDSNRFIKFRINDTDVYGKIIDFFKRNDAHLHPDKYKYQTSLIIESLDGRRYTYDFYKTIDNNDSFLSLTEFTKQEDVFDFIENVKLEDISLSLTSKKFFNLYEEIRDSIGYPIPLNQHTANLSINLFRGLFNLIALNNYLRKYHPRVEVRQISLSDFDEDRHFVSFLNSQGERVPGRLIEINNYSVTVVELNGHRSIIEGEALNTVFQDKSVKLLFHPNTPYAQLEMSGDPAQDAFRKALIAGRFEEDEHFISLDYNGRKLAKVIFWDEDAITLHLHHKGDKDNDSIVTLFLPPFDLRFRELWDNSRFSTAAISREAKEYFERNDHLSDRRNIRVASDEDYQFLSRSTPATEMINGGTVWKEIDFMDPSLRKWMRKATDIIKEKTGITPGPQNLTAAQRIQIYRIFHEDIVPLVENPRKGIEGGYDFYHSLLFYDYILHLEEDDHHNVFRLLGHLLDTKSAVCAELSAFGAVLFSEYGLHTKYMQTSQQMDEIPEIKNVHGHAWIGVQREDGSLEFIDTNGRIFWSTNLRLLRERYPEGLSHLSDDKLLSLSEEYILVTPPSPE